VKNQNSKCYKLAAFGTFFVAIAFYGQSSATANEHIWPAAMNDNVADDDSLDNCLRSAIATGESCILPEGTLILTRYPSALRQEIPSGIVDLGGATLRGQGASTVIKGVSPRGFDVISLNGVANFNIQNLAITTVATDGVDAHGINGISMTNGTNNIRINNVHVYDLPYVEKQNYIDGGKAFTVQTGAYNTAIRMKNIYVEQSSSQNVLIGFEMDADTNTNLEPDNINVIGNTFEGYLAGIIFSFVSPNQPMNVFGAAVLDNAVHGGKHGIALGRGRAYYLKGNYVVLRDDLYRNFIAGDFIESRQPLLLFDVTYLTAELNTFQMSAGDFFLRAVGADPSRTIFRYNNFYGNPQGRAHLTNCTADFQSYFDAAGTFY
jgi:hypothetical protein